MILAILRTLILFLIIVIALRLMGKRQIGQLQPYELVVILMLSELAIIPMENIDMPMTSGLVPIITLVTVQILLAYLTLRSENARGIVCGRPTILVENGKILELEMARIRYNINDLLEQLRTKDVFNLADVEYAILETGGQLSVILKSQKRPVVPADLGVSTHYEGLPVTLIIDGYVFQNNLSRIKLSQEWLLSELKKFGIDSFKDVLFASLDTEGKLFYQQKANRSTGGGSTL